MSEEAELIAVRTKIKSILDEIVQAEKREKAALEAQFARESVVNKGLIYTGAVFKGVWDGAVGLVEFVGKAAQVVNYLLPVEHVNNLLSATYQSYQAGELTKAQWRDSLVARYKDEECKDLAKILGFDPRTVTAAQLKQLKQKLTEAYELASYIWEDKPSKQLFVNFSKEYAAAQHSTEVAEFGGGLVFEVVLAAILVALTGGAGNVAQAGGKLRHAGILGKLDSPLTEMGNLLKRIKLRKKVAPAPNTVQKAVAVKPDGVPLKAKSAQRTTPPKKAAETPNGRAGNEPGKNLNGQNTACDAKTCTGGEPISLVTGEEILECTDFSITGVMPLTWTRRYKSSNANDVGLGHGWTYSFLEKLVINGDSLEYHTHEARIISFPLPAAGATSINRAEKWSVERMADDYYLVTPLNNPAALVREFSGPLEDGSYPLRSLSDAVGNRIACHYEQSRLTTIEAPHGDRWLLEYNARGQIVAVHAVTTNNISKTVATYSYDIANDLIRAADAGGHSEQYAYDNHLIKRRTLKSGYSFHFQWDGHTSAARCIRNWGDAIEGQPTYDYRFEWDKPQRKVRVTDTRGGVELYEFNESGLPVYHRDQEGGETFSEYDQSGNLISQTDPLGQTRQYTYDQHDRLLCVINADGTQTSFAYDEHSNANALTDAAGQVWKREFNVLGQLTKQSNPLGDYFRYQYNVNGQVSAIINPLNEAWHYVWNDRAQLIAARNPQGLNTRYQYDDENNLIAVIGSGGQRTEYAYDANGRCTLIKTPDGRSQQFEYNALGLLTQQRDASGRITQYHYNGLSQVVKRVDPLGHTLQYHYDGERNLVGLTNEKGERYTLKYDLNERLIEEIGFDGRVQRYEYNAAGHLIASSALGADGKTVERRLRYERDGNGQMLEQWADPTAVQLQKQCLGQYAYDPLGRLISAQNAERHLRWSFDAAGRVVEDYQDDAVLKHTYDGLGRRIATQTPEGVLLRYDFDATNALTAMSFDSFELARVHRDDFGREIGRELGPQLNTETGYDPQGRLQKHRTLKRAEGQARASVFIARQYHYNDVGQISRIDDSLRGRTQYHYDTIDRLVRVEGPNPESFVHDPAGNILAHSEDHAGFSRGNRLAYQGDNHYQYDAQGNRIAQQRGKDRKLETTYTYDALNQLIAVKASGIETRYAYDALGRRIRKENSESETAFLWNGDVLFRETTRATAKNNQNDSAERTRTYLFEPYSFKPLAFIQDQQLYYYHLDHLGTPQEVTDHRGTIVWSGNYKAYGSLALAQTQLIDNPLRFQGQYFDEETGLHYNRFRYYDPNVGRFINQDPIGLLGGINNYQYVPNPISWVDPYGLSCKEVDFYVGPSGADSTLPSTGYRYMGYKNADGSVNKYAQQAIDTKEARLSYFGFEKLETGDQVTDAFQIRAPKHVTSLDPDPAWSDGRLRLEFDTLQLYENGTPNVSVPFSHGGAGSTLEPFTSAYPQYGSGGVQQLIPSKTISIKADQVDILPEK